jgi:hypothetical protein
MLIGAEGARLLREYGAGETPQALKRRGGSPYRPRKAKRLERKSTDKYQNHTQKGGAPKSYTFETPSVLFA